MNIIIKKIKNSYLDSLKESKNDLLNSNLKKKKKRKSILNHINCIKHSSISNSNIKCIIQLGTKQIEIKDLLNINIGEILSVEEFNQDLLDIFIDDILIAQGKLVFLKPNWGIKIVKIIHCC